MRFLIDVGQTAAFTFKRNFPKIPPPRISPKEGFEDSVITEIPAELEWEGKKIKFKGSKPEFSWQGRLVLKISAEPLRGNLATMNTADFIGEVGVIGTYRIHELGPTRFSGQAEFIYGECECPILEDPDYDCVENDRQKLSQNDRSSALLAWARDQVEVLAEKMETNRLLKKSHRNLNTLD